MKAYMIYKDESDHARTVIDYLRDFERQTGKTLDVVDPESLDGATFCSTYDIVEYPSILAVDDGGIVQNIWRGTNFPTISELSYYA